ncbi:protein DpdG [Microbispora triticiradicis]|uniref:protein DpdG n=1 Tax=Microbispora triticiradicis TaxID=2200763 RepID=UPI00296FDA92|nr:protein DpdG [Microbispora triticiradicis]
MALINDPASRPAPMWALVRFLASEKHPVSVERAKGLLTPPGIVGSDHKVFDWAASTLESLRLLSQSEDGLLRLAGPAQTLDGDDYTAFTNVLRNAVLSPELNLAIGDNSSQHGPRDLCRALCWFLTLDPAGEAIGRENYPRLQAGALKPEVKDPIVNDNRWGYFKDWASALGFAGVALPTSGDASYLVPDCTVAVRQTVQMLWKPGATVSALELLGELRKALPVLPGGAYSTAVGLDSPGENVAGSALSFALLRGADEGWVALERNADARRFMSVHDPDRPTYPRSYSSVKIFKDPNG